MFNNAFTPHTIFIHQAELSVKNKALTKLSAACAQSQEQLIVLELAIRTEHTQIFAAFSKQVHAYPWMLYMQEYYLKYMRSTIKMCVCLCVFISHKLD